MVSDLICTGFSDNRHEPVTALFPLIGELPYSIVIASALFRTLTGLSIPELHCPP
jgi:hypothetical protein